MAAGIPAFKDHIDAFICNSNEAVNFKLVKDESDIEKRETIFHPDMSHQIFGEKEQIFGFSDLTINIFYTASQLNCYVGTKYSGKIDSTKYGGVEVDDIFRKMQEVLPPGYCMNLDQFSNLLQKDCDFQPHGEKVYEYQHTVTGCSRCFELFNPSIMKDSGFKQYHERMQTFLLWFVDAATYIDDDDDKWEYYTIYEKHIGEMGKPIYYFVGYCTVYNFYAYPQHCRPRISQFLILPPYQRQGHATEVLEAICRRLISRPNVRDICVEDPSENFQRIRDFIDCRNCLKYSCFRPEKLLHGYSVSMEKECNEELKLNKRQSRRVYEILRLKYTNVLDESSFRPYRLEVKKRLNKPFTGKLLRSMKMKAIVPPDEERFSILEGEFSRILEEYLPVVKRLNLHT